MKVVYSLLLIFFSFSIFAQTTEPSRCAHDELMEAYEKSNPGYQQKINESFEEFYKNKKDKTDRFINITIPIHVILVHPTGQPIGTGTNFSLAHVQSQIDVLNQDFGRYNSDAGNTPPEFPAAETGIQFCLASVDPDGNPTDGITRYEFDGNYLSNAVAIRAETRWPRESYANIWSVAGLPYLGAVGALPTSFALPSLDDDYIDVDAATFGGPGFGTQPSYNLGRTTTHEMGHWLGLRHVWGTGNGSCSVDDNITDTPNQTGSNFGCPNHPSPTCGNNGDMFMNYMDYVDDNCMNAFTQGQGEYMNNILATSRASLNGSSFTACAASTPLVLNLVSQENPSCADINDGVIFVEAAGGNPPYSFSLDGGVPSSNNLFTDLPGGNHNVEVFDADGASDIINVFLDTPLPITATVIINQVNNCPNEMNGSVELQVAGGSNPFIYSLDMGLTQSSNVFDNLADGFYVINIEDNSGCIFTDVFELTSSSAINITIDSTANLICGNDDMGLIIASAEGGMGPLSYSINGFDFQDSGEFLNLDGGSYFVYVQDSTGCYDSLGVTIMEPDPFFISLQSNDVTCFGLNDGNLEISAMGGNGGPFQYSFDSITFGDATMLDNLFAGAYDLYALDSLGCLAIASFEIEEPDEIQIVIDSLTNVNCFGETNGMVNLLATGGNGGYSYIFQGDTTATGTYDNLTVGTYDIAVFDINGCEGSSTFEIGLNSTIAIELVSAEPTSCFGVSDGSIQVTATNTQGDVTYSINNGTPQMTPIFEDLPVGDYQVVVQDSTGCNSALDVTISEPEMLVSQVELVNNVTCNGGSDGNVNIITTGGTSPFTYTFEDPSTDQFNLASGDYIVTVTDLNECFVVNEFSISEPEELELLITNQEDVDCNTGMGGAINLNAIGGTEEYEYTVDGTTGSFTNNTGIFEALEYGSHVVSVVDANGCSTVSNVNITLENEFYAELLSVDPILCNGQRGGGIDIEVTGGMGEVIYILNGALIEDPKALDALAGDYLITIIDENNCGIEFEFTLEEPTALTIDNININAETVTVIATGGTMPYVYSFDEGVTFSEDNVYELMGSSTINVIVRDANGCEVESTTFIDSVEDYELDLAVKAYPNPFQEILHLDFTLPYTLSTSIEVFDIRGKSVYNIPTKIYKAGNNFVKLDLSNFASSIYIVKIASAEGYRYIKVTKM